MSKPVTWGIRVTQPDGRVVLVRQGGTIGKGGPIATYYTKAVAEADAVRLGTNVDGTIEVFERSHGRQFPSASEAQAPGSDSLANEWKP